MLSWFLYCFANSGVHTLIATVVPSQKLDASSALGAKKVISRRKRSARSLWQHGAAWGLRPPGLNSEVLDTPSISPYVDKYEVD